MFLLLLVVGGGGSSGGSLLGGSGGGRGSLGGGDGSTLLAGCGGGVGGDLGSGLGGGLGAGGLLGGFLGLFFGLLDGLLGLVAVGGALLDLGLAGLFAGGGVASGLGAELLLELLGLLLLVLHAVDVLHQVALVLEDVTLGLEVELAVEVLVDLLVGAVLLEHAAENAEAAHPDVLGGHAGFAGTNTATAAFVAAHLLGFLGLAPAGAGVDGDGLLEDDTILDELADGLARGGLGDVLGLVGVEPDATTAAAEDVGGKASLESKRNHFLNVGC